MGASRHLKTRQLGPILFQVDTCYNRFLQLYFHVKGTFDTTKYSFHIQIS